MKIGLMSDTHGHLDPKLYEHFIDCEEIWHAGDIGHVQLADTLESFKKFRAVYGNIDGHELRVIYPEELVFECEGCKIYMTHIGGYPGRYPGRVREKLILYKPDIFICGHSHILKVMRDKNLELIHLNPGACGVHGFHRMKTLIRFELIKGKLQNVEVIELGLRGKIQ